MVAESSSSAAQTLFDVSNFPKAGEFLNACLSQQYFVVCYGGAIRGGKTFSSLGALVLLHKMFPGSRSVIVRDTLETLKKNTLPSLTKAFPSNFIKDFNGTDYQWRFTNGSNCMFMSENADRDPDMDRWNGLEYNFILLEQAEELREKTFFKAIERAGSYVLPGGLKQPRPIILITVNPTDTWVRKLFYEPYMNGTLPEGWLYIPARIDDNPHIPDSYKESLLQMKIVNPIHYERFVGGNWDVKEATGNEFYPGFNRSVHVLPTPYLPNVPIMQGWDANALPYSHMLQCQPHREGGILTLRFFYEYALTPPRSGLRNTGKQFLLDRKANSWQSSPVFLTGDASLRNRKVGEESGSNFEDVQAAVLPALHGSSADLWPKKNAGVMRRGDFLNFLLRGGLPNVRVQIDPALVKLIEDLEQVQKGVEGKVKRRINDKELGASYEPLGHASDNLDYVCTTLLAAEYEAFKNGRDD
jgi:hypothetical protein